MGWGEDKFLVDTEAGAIEPRTGGGVALRRSRTCDTEVSLGNSNFSSDKPSAS